MGYRSDVAIKVYGDAFLMVEFETEYVKRFLQLPELEQKWINDIITDMFEANGFTDDGFSFYVEQIKWYDDEVLVVFYEELMLKAKYLGLNVEFIRLGEEMDDNETNYIGDDLDYKLGINRSICGVY
jgi:hypothetical protein